MSTEQHIHTNPIINLTYIKGTEHRLSIITPNHNLVNLVISTWFPASDRHDDGFDGSGALETNGKR